MQKEYLKTLLGEAFFAHPRALQSLLERPRPDSEVVATQAPAPLTFQDSSLKTSHVITSRQDLVSSEQKLLEIQKEMGDCTRCKLSDKRTHLVFGKGNPNARLMFVGEGPGEQEDLQGLPFVGKAGQLLDKIIEAMGFKVSEVYIANVVKCRPPGNRTPEEDEMTICGTFLKQQIQAIQPQVLVALGSTALRYLIGADAKITKSRGTLLEYPVSEGSHVQRNIPLMPTFHPSYLLRNPDAKKEVWSDMKQVMSLLAHRKEA